ncbi:hypothetical protein BCR39DRAFT_25288 [Naematelia encephala]|uniref:Uncharacterized protein n=1 Tax=Naematelia encephala TaxID=71784 RepID=A0A1Y2BM36_9TREE|nr:hypothetical protein BCR39DRAFT_25288 [Naematelia encephala]
MHSFHDAHRAYAGLVSEEFLMLLSGIRRSIQRTLLVEYLLMRTERKAWNAKALRFYVCPYLTADKAYITTASMTLKTPAKRRMDLSNSQGETSESTYIFIGRAHHAPFIFDSSPPVSKCNRAWLKGEPFDESTYLKEKKRKVDIDVVVDLTEVHVNLQED